MDRIKFVYGKPALRVEDALVLADLHIGMESELWARGIRVALLESLRKDVLELLEETGAGRLVILGDLKHSITGAERYEWAGLRSFILELSGLVSVFLVPGNHDGGIRELAGGLEIVPSGGMRLGDAGFCHGHAGPSEEVMSAKTLVVAHSHPCVFLGREGRLERVWVRGKLGESELVVMPAFNPLLGGAAVNGAGRLLGPVAGSEAFKLDAADIYTLNGARLGSAGSLRTEERE